MKHVQKSAMKIELQSKLKFQKLNTKYCQKQIFEQPMPVLITVLQKNKKIYKLLNLNPDFSTIYSNLAMLTMKLAKIKILKLVISVSKYCINSGTKK